MIYILVPYHLGGLKYDMISKDWLPSLNAQDRILRISAFHNKSKSFKKDYFIAANLIFVMVDR